MVVVCNNLLDTLGDIPKPNGNGILNGPGKLVVILDPTSKSDLCILSEEYRKHLELSVLRQPGTEGAPDNQLFDEPDRDPLVSPASSVPPAQGALSDRQRDVLKLIVQGMSNKEIARTLGLAEGTVKIHVAALFGKLGVHRRAAVAIAGVRFLSDPPAPESESQPLQSIASLFELTAVMGES
jgi:DNA-binding CsgD family transcriptional regulator